jgi:hypothetical protein
MPPAAHCIVRDANDIVDSVAITPATVDFCSGEDAARTCWHVDVGTKRVEGRPIKEKSDASPAAPSGVTRNTDGSVTICTPSAQCSTVTPKITIGETDALGTNADGTILVRDPNERAVELYDVPTWKRRAKIAPWKTAMGNPAPLPEWTFAGPNIIAWANATPVSSKGRIFTLAGKLVGEIGDKAFTQNVADSWDAQGTTWLFKQLDAPRLIAVDVTTGKLVRTYQLAQMAANTNDPTVGAAGVATTGDAIIYLAHSGVVGVIARATGTIEMLSPPRCP